MFLCSMVASTQQEEEQEPPKKRRRRRRSEGKEGLYDAGCTQKLMITFYQSFGAPTRNNAACETLPMLKALSTL